MYTLVLVASLSILQTSSVSMSARQTECPPTNLDMRYKAKFGRFPPATERRAGVQRDFAERSSGLFGRLDRDGNGIVTKQEWGGARKILANLACEGQPLDFEDYAIEKAHESADLDGDGEITREEWNRSRTRAPSHRYPAPRS